MSKRRNRLQAIWGRMEQSMYHKIKSWVWCVFPYPEFKSISQIHTPPHAHSKGLYYTTFISILYSSWTNAGESQVKAILRQEYFSSVWNFLWRHSLPLQPNPPNLLNIWKEWESRMQYNTENKTTQFYISPYQTKTADLFVESQS